MSQIFLTTILGQTSSGKSDYAVQCASNTPNSIIVNCDSRQIYKKLNVGTGKVPGAWDGEYFMYGGVRHTLIDYVDPAIHYDLAKYIQDFIALVEREREKGMRHFFVVGGTGLYAQALVDSYEIDIVAPDYQSAYTKLKDDLGSLSTEDLQAQIPAEQILNQSDFHNPRRLINAILRSTARTSGWSTPLRYPQFANTKNTAIKIDQNLLRDNISKRLDQRIAEGLIEEVASLAYLGTERLNALGLEYRIIHEYLNKPNLNKEQAKQDLLTANLQLAKRQLTWLKKRDINWITLR